MNDAAYIPEFMGLQVLVVEDEALVALQLEDMLTESGCAVVGPASRVRQALDLLEGQHVDAAILDLNIAGELVYPVADRLTTLGLPYIFATAYEASALTEPHRGRLVLQKPFTRRQLLQTMQQAFQGARTPGLSEPNGEER